MKEVCFPLVEYQLNQKDCRIKPNLTILDMLTSTTVDVNKLKTFAGYELYIEAEYAFVQIKKEMKPYHINDENLYIFILDGSYGYSSFYLIYLFSRLEIELNLSKSNYNIISNEEPYLIDEIHEYIEETKKTGYADRIKEFLNIYYEDVVEEEIIKEEYVYNTEHPSHAQIRFARVNSGKGVRFYGSELTQDTYIELIVQQSKMDRTLNHNYYFAYGPNLIRLRMSTGQFSDLITSLNSGSGTPCTIETINGKKIDELPYVKSETEIIKEDFSKDLVELIDRFNSFENNVKKLLEEKQHISTNNKKEIIKEMSLIKQDIESNMPFVLNSFTKNVSKVVHEAKCEIENAISHKIQQFGIKQLNLNQKVDSLTLEND